MASTSGFRKSCHSNESKDMLNLHEMFQIVGDQFTTKDIRSLKFLYKQIMPGNVFSKVNDGYSFLLALEKLGRIDETNFKHLLQVLRIIKRHDLAQYVTLRRRKTVVPDPVDEYLQESATRAQQMAAHILQTGVSRVTTAIRPHSPDHQPDYDRPLKRPRLSTTQAHSKRVTRSQTKGDNPEDAVLTGLDKEEEKDEIKKNVTCDIRLRVRAEYCDHENALEGNIFSNKPDLVERQFEKFMQANTILKSRDLGSIICDIKFSELTYLDAFWRDYINGSLLESLKGVFITESLKQAVGHEAIKLLVNVDEDDYEAGRIKLLKNLTD